MCRLRRTAPESSNLPSDDRGSLVETELPIDVAFDEGDLVHAVDIRRRFVLSEDETTPSADMAATVRSVASHAGHDDSHTIAPVDFGRTLHHDIGGRFVPADGFSVAQKGLDELALSSQFEMAAAVGEEDMIGP